MASDWDVVPDTPATAQAPANDDWSVVQHMPQVTVAAQKPQAPEPGLWDTIKSSVSTGIDNLNKEVSGMTPLEMAHKIGQGVVHGAGQFVLGAGQLVNHGASAVADFVNPKSSVAQSVADNMKTYDQATNNIENMYQQATKGSVLAGIGTAGGITQAPVAVLKSAIKSPYLLSKVMGGVTTGATAGLTAPVYGDNGQPADNYATQKTIQTGAGAALGGTLPIASKLGLEAASRLGSTAAENSLVATKAQQVFGNSPNPSADAEIIKDLAGVKDRIGDRKLLTTDLAARQGKYVSDASDAIKAAGVSPDEMRQFSQWQGLTQQEQDALRATPTGDAIANIMTKLDRVRGLTPGELSTNSGGIVRAAIDTGLPEYLIHAATGGVSIPIATGLRAAMKNQLGGRVTRAASAENLLNPRTQAAADMVLQQNGQSSASDGMDYLQQMAQKAQAAQAAKDAAATASAGSQQQALDALKIKARQMTGTPGGGAYQALLQHTGLQPDDLNSALRVASRIPEVSDAANSVRVQGTNTADGAIYPLTDIIKSIAGKQGALSTPTAAPGALSGATAVRDPVQYAHGVAQRAAAYDQGSQAVASMGLPAATVKDAQQTIANIRTLGGSDNRKAAIQALMQRNPEAADALKSIFNSYK